MIQYFFFLSLFVLFSCKQKFRTWLAISHPSCLWFSLLWDLYYEYILSCGQAVFESTAGQILQTLIILHRAGWKSCGKKSIKQRKDTRQKTSMFMEKKKYVDEKRKHIEEKVFFFSWRFSNLYYTRIRISFTYFWWQNGNVIDVLIFYTSFF